MTRRSCYWYFDDIPYDWPMTIEIDENEAKILSVTIPIERENGETVDMRFLPESEYDKLKAERDYLWMNANPTAYELRTVRAQWKKDRDENDKLRELLRNALTYIEYEGCGIECPETGNSATLTPCDTCNRYETESCAYVIEQNARELGIEVDE